MKKLLIGESYQSVFCESLSEHQLELIPIKANPNLCSPVQYHADLSVLKVNNHIFASDYLKESLSPLSNKYTIEFLKGQGPEYPKDCIFNLKIIGNFAVLNRKAIPERIVTYLTINGYTILDVKQGYAGCSICAINNHAAITSDQGIAKILIKHGINVLQIKPGSIKLKGYDYGFIGGSSIKISDNYVLFSGSFYNHPDNYKILKFLKSENCKFSFLSKQDIFDFGSGIIIE